jgi:hypothetical protein
MLVGKNGPTIVIQRMKVKSMVSAANAASKTEMRDAGCKMRGIYCSIKFSYALASPILALNFNLKSEI